ncbi:receptor-like protein eix1 [Quercus suber]|uniref:Receptor-like protein eix1 n=1 Tax=Quercus suber TaxID=58331 RepID=A0AAW0K950_QUESU
MASMKTTFLLALIFLLLQTEFISLEAIWSNSSAGNSTVGCIDMEREALLKFKEGLEDPSRTLSSWVGEDCCNWLGVGCSNRTGNIIKLDLNGQHLCDQMSGNTSTECWYPLIGVLSPSLLELKYLNYLDLSYNDFQETPIPNVIGSLNKLTYLNLSNAWFIGTIPPQIGNLSNLLYLDLSFAFFDGTIPPQIGNLSNLLYLDLSFAFFDGTIPPQIGNLSNLLYLDLSFAFFDGTIPPQIGNLSNLLYLDLSENPFLTASNLNWLSGLSSLKYLNLNDVDLSEATTDWLQTVNLLPSLLELHLASCELHYLPQNFPSVNSSSIPQWVFNFTSLTKLYLSYCNLTGSIPKIPKGPMPIRIGQEMSQLVQLDLSDNFLNGSIPSSINGLRVLGFLRLSNNHFSGNIHNHWEGMLHLFFIDLSRNNLSGGIPSSMCSLPRLSWLQLSNNNLSGNLSFGLKFLSRWISTLDFGGNRLSGTIPTWIGERNFSIRILRLRGNMLYGKIPKQLCGLTSIHVLDLAHNNFSGSIPTCLGSLVGYIDSNVVDHMNIPRWAFSDHCREYDPFAKEDSSRKTLRLGFNGTRKWEIPVELTNLTLLNSLNLSWNRLTGKILENIGALHQLETLDLSCNNLSGHIPPSMSSMTFLSHLNLSYNNLSGQIPSSNQFQTFNDPSIYVGNPQLHGPPPLPTSVLMPSDRKTEHKNQEDVHVNIDGEDQFEKLWFYLSIALGFIVGFWAVCGSLLMKKTWRYIYFCIAYKMKDKRLVAIAVNMTCLQRKIQATRH